MAQNELTQLPKEHEHRGEARSAVGHKIHEVLGARTRELDPDRGRTRMHASLSIQASGHPLKQTCS